MAVVVQCFHCQAILELDEGFRGGVCRCSSCGTLLQVPRGDGDSPVRRVRPAAPPPGPVRPAAGPRETPATGNQETGLSSGAVGSGALSERGAGEPGLSSGLGQVHKTRPISHVPKKKERTGTSSKEKEVSMSGGTGTKGSSTRDSSAKFPDVANMPRQEPKERNLTMIVISVVLLLAIAGVVGMLLYQLFHL